MPPGSASNCPFLDDPVLTFVKAFRLKGDTNSLKRLAYERFSSEFVERAKKALWDLCGSSLEAASLPFHMRQDSDRRSQLEANNYKYKKSFLLNEGDIGMANYEKQVEQEAAYPIPISLYNCYRIVRHEKRYISGVAMPLFSCLTVL